MIHVHVYRGREEVNDAILLCVCATSACEKMGKKNSGWRAETDRASAMPNQANGRCNHPVLNIYEEWERRRMWTKDLGTCPSRMWNVLGAHVGADSAPHIARLTTNQLPQDIPNGEELCDADDMALRRRHCPTHLNMACRSKSAAA